MASDVGIVMPVYRQKSKLFKQAIKSIIHQKYPYFQLIIVIDGVTPNVAKIARKYASKDSRITVITNTVNSGTDVALNYGFEFLQSQTNIKYFTWVSSDNIYYPDFVGVLRERLETSPPQVGLVYSGFHIIAANGKRKKNSWDERLDQPKENLIDGYFIGYSFMYKKIFAQKIDGYKYTPVEDYDYFLRLTEHCDITFVPQKLMAFRSKSPYSNSLQIKNSVEKSRKKRYLKHLLLKEARERRNITPLLTIIFPVADSSASTIQALEGVLDQSFSNYKLIIHDVTTNKEFLSVINRIPDVRIKYFSTPNGTLNDIILRSLEFIDTPLVMFFRQGSFRKRSNLKKIVHSNYSNPPGRHNIGGDSIPEFGKIYQSDFISSFS